jgi:hypothetical protein
MKTTILGFGSVVCAGVLVMPLLVETALSARPAPQEIVSRVAALEPDCTGLPPAAPPKTAAAPRQCSVLPTLASVPPRRSGPVLPREDVV